MTFDQLKSAFLANARPLEFCKSYHDAVITTDINSLILSNIDIAIWLYTAGIVTDDLLSNIDQSVLNANGIYSSGTFNILNPVGKVYVLGNATVSLTANGNNATELHALGTGVVNIALADNGFCELGAYLSSNVVVNATDNSTICLSTFENSNVAATLNNTSSAFMILNWLSALNLVGNDTSFANVKGYDKACLSLLMNNAATYKFSSFDKSSIVNNNLT